MDIRRVVTNVRTDDLAASRAFYVALGFVEVMDLGWVVTLASPDNPTAQLTLVTREETGPVVPDVSVEVGDVDAAYEAARASGAEIVHPLTDESWGVRRFFVRDPNGRVLNVVAHRT